MDLLFGIGLLFALFGDTTSQDLCLREIRGWEGRFKFPDTKLSETFNNPFYTESEDMSSNCVFYMETYGSVDTVLKFMDVKIGRSSLQIKELVEEKGKQSWKVLQTLSGNIPSIEVHATKANVKIVVPKNAGTFTMEYELITCPLPSPMLIAAACTKGLFMDSHCIFECGEGYFPAQLDDPRRHAHCTRGFLSIVTGDSTYGWDSDRRNLETACVPSSVVDKDCLGEQKPGQANRCPYSFNDLLRIVGEDGIESKGRSPLGAPSSSGTSESLKLTQVPQRCRKYCNRISGGSYSTSCAVVKKLKAKRTCVRCRYSSQRFCSGGMVLI